MPLAGSPPSPLPPAPVLGYKVSREEGPPLLPETPRDEDSSPAPCCAGRGCWASPCPPLPCLLQLLQLRETPDLCGRLALLQDQDQGGAPAGEPGGEGLRGGVHAHAQPARPGEQRGGRHPVLPGRPVQPEPAEQRARPHPVPRRQPRPGPSPRPPRPPRGPQPVTSPRRGTPSLSQALPAPQPLPLACGEGSLGSPWLSWPARVWGPLSQTER
uniref:Uncharacterized protein n=2 Tax=Mustela putorius furo TaxID=9669 RepID=M3XSQ0_MUSPF